MTGCQVNYSNFIRAPKIDIKLCTSTVNRHGLGLGAWQRDISDEFKVLGVDNAKHVRLGVWPLASAFHVIIFVHRIVDTAIHIGGQFYFIEDLVIAATYQVDRSGLRVSLGNDEGIWPG